MADGLRNPSVKRLFALRRYAVVQARCCAVTSNFGRDAMNTMDGNENRQIARDSLFLMAALRIDGFPGENRIKVRNLSEGGMMGEGSVRVVRGTLIEVHIRNIGWVKGSVAWVQESRFGVAFLEPIDPRLARGVPTSEGDPAPRFTRNHQPYMPSGTVRKV